MPLDLLTTVVFAHQFCGLLLFRFRWNESPIVCLYNHRCCDICCVPAVSVHLSGIFGQTLAQKVADTKLFQGKKQNKNIILYVIICQM